MIHLLDHTNFPGFSLKTSRSCARCELSPPPVCLPISYCGDRRARAPQGLISSSVQIFFAWRIKVLSANLILFSVIVFLAIPQFGASAILRPSDRLQLVGSQDPDLRLSSFRSCRDCVYHLNRQGRILCRLLELQQCDHRMGRLFDSLRYRDHRRAHDDFGTFDSHL